MADRSSEVDSKILLRTVLNNQEKADVKHDRLAEKVDAVKESITEHRIQDVKVRGELVASVAQAHTRIGGIETRLETTARSKKEHGWALILAILTALLTILGVIVDKALSKAPPQSIEQRK